MSIKTTVKKYFISKKVKTDIFVKTLVALKNLAKPRSDSHANNIKKAKDFTTADRSECAVCGLGSSTSSLPISYSMIWTN